MKRFNTAGVCIPEEDYMVDITPRLQNLRELIEDKKYLLINRGRQYGKTTTLYMLERYISDTYYVVSLSFEAADDLFTSDREFVAGFIGKCARSLSRSPIDTKLIDDWKKTVPDNLYWDELGVRITALCERTDKPVVLLIDEVDKSSDNQIFLTFLGLLRDKYLERRKTGEATFQSVILSGVYDIRNLKRKLRPDEEHKFNSPWNIADPFDMPMEFSISEIADMLSEYEQDHHTGMDTGGMAESIYDLTSGYPFLVSKLCRMLDDNGAVWTEEALATQVKMLLSEKLPLFDSLKNRLIDYPEMNERIQRILFGGESIPDAPDDEGYELAKMFGFIKCVDSCLYISNRIFETRLYNYYASTSQALSSDIYKAGADDKGQYIKNGRLDMDAVIGRFAIIFNDIYGDKTAPFVEEEGRRYFLLFLKPIINGTGNYYIESETRDRTRTDVIVDYQGEQFIIELKIWRGDSYNRRGEQQLRDYLDYYHTDHGWMVSFCFNQNKKIGIQKVQLGDMTITEAIV